MGRAKGVILMLESTQQDIHVIKYFSSFVSIRKGKVINVTEPKLIFCPLAKHLYRDFDDIDGTDKEKVKEAIKKAISYFVRKEWEACTFGQF